MRSELNNNMMKTYVIIIIKILNFLQLTVIESHPDNMFEDLRLDQPFPQLQTFSDSLDLTSMSKLVK
jgi:hypothetical protein